MSGIVVKSNFKSIRADSIVDLDIQEYNSGYSDNSTVNRVSFTAGENITAKSLISLSADGKLYKASSLISDNKPCFGIAYNAGVIGETIQLYNNGEVIELDATFDTSKFVYFNNNNSLSTTYSYNSGYWYHRIGIALSINSFVVRIEEYKKML